MSDSLQLLRLKPSRLLWPWDFPGKNTGVGCHFLLQGILLTLGYNLCLLDCRKTLDHWAIKALNLVFLNSESQFHFPDTTLPDPLKTQMSINGLVTLRLLYWLHQSLWLCGSQQTGKFFKRWEYQTTWPAPWEICMQVHKQQLKLDTEQQTGSKLGKEYVKVVYRHPAYLTYMQSI